MDIRQFWAGFFAAAGFLALLIGAVARFVPDFVAISPLARLLDSLSPWFLAVALLAGLVVLFLRRLAGMVLLLGTLAAGAHLWLGHRAVSLPLAENRDADLRILFFNTFGVSDSGAERLVAAALAADPDILVLAEGEGIRPSLARLQARYEFTSPCQAEGCELILATRRAPLRFWTLSLNAAWEDRYAVAELRTEAGQQFFLSAAHLAKPWLSGIAESEQAKLIAQYNWFSGPVLAVGDFNAAPWGYSLRNILQQTGMKALRNPVPSWPVWAGALGVPIDHVLVGGGVRVVSARAFGAGLGSNHRGLWAEIALP